jgi:hypothetical protein
MLKTLLCAAVLCGLAASASADFVAGDYSQVSYVPAASSTITSGGTAQTVRWTLTAAKIRCVQNPGSATEDLFVQFGGTAASTASHDLPAGVQICWPWNGQVSVYGATTSHAFIAFEAQ